MIVINQQQTGYNNCDLTRVSTNHHHNRKSNQLINTKRVNYKLSDMHNYRYQFNCLSTFFVSKVIVIFFILIPIIFKSPIVNGERISTGCKFYPIGENRRFERVAENLQVGHEVFRVEVHPRMEIKLEAVDNSLSDINYFKYEELDDKTVAIKLAHSLEDLVDRRDPQSVLKFKLTCRGPSGTEDAFLPITVYVQDVNDHAPEFQNVPYYLEVDELTPIGLTIFRGIHAIDKDKPNTANSDITYSIVGGNENNSFILSDPIEGILVVNKALDYDHGIREFKIQIQASDHGDPISLSQVTTMTIRIKDADDQNPVFTQEVYKASVSETPTITGQRIREKVVVDPVVHAFDLDQGINARLRYNIILGNEGGFFEMHDQTGELFLVREIDLESLPNSVLSLQIQATQVDNPLRQALSRVDVFVKDINDNSPEFEYDMYNITVMENLPPGFTVLQVYAVDADKGENAEFKYVLHDESDGFQIDSTTGWISVKDPAKLDRETQSKIQMKVTAIERKPNVNPDAVKQGPQTTVEINLLDANDNNPQFFPSNIYHFNVLETAPTRTILGSIFAHDNDLAENGQVIYYKQNDSLSQRVPFDVYPGNGSIYVLDSFLALPKKQESYTFFVIASDSAKIAFERRTSVAVIRINVTDINNSVPEFIGAPYEAYVGESLPEGAYVTQVLARDADSINDVLEYSIIAGNDDKLFFIDSRNGKILTSAVLDYEKKQSYDLLIQVSDGINTAVAPILVHVVDINDQSPIFAHNFYNFSVIEELGGNDTVGTVLALDRDSGKNGQIRYNLVGDQANNAFIIDPFNGAIRTRRRLDRETESTVDFIVIAFDGGIPQLSGTTNVQVKIEDINDNPPFFDREMYEVEVPEEVDPPYEVARITASDKDYGDNAVIKYLILAGNEDKSFAINPDTGLISTTEKLNYERKTEHILHVAARNLRPFQGPQAASIVNPAVQVTIRVKDINDELVVFDQQSYHFKIIENMAPNQIIGQLNATNPRRVDSEQDIIYWLAEDKTKKPKFKIIPKTGEIFLVETVDRDPPASEHSFKLRAYARDSLSINTFNTSVPVIIDVLDVNDNAPTFDEERYMLELPESLPPGTIFPSFFKARDSDAGLNGKIVSYHLNGSDSELEMFKIDNKTGTISLGGSLDYETQATHEFVVIALDGGDPPNIGSATVVIGVTNINEHSPKFVGLPYEFWAQENAQEGTSVGQVKATDEDGNNIIYSITDGDTDYFTIEEKTGRIFVRKGLASRTSYTFVARATDDGLPTNYSLGVQVKVLVKEANDFPPVFTSNSYRGRVIEKQESNKVIIKVEALDKDLQNNTISYSIASGNEQGIFIIDRMTGEIRVMPGLGSKIDYDKQKQFTLLVQATDSHKTPLFGLTMVTIDVADVNDHPPTFTKMAYSASLPENLPSGHCFIKIEAVSGDAVDSIKYSLSEAKDSGAFGINAVSGDICTKKVLDRETQDKYEFTVVASDGKYESFVPVVVEMMDENDNPPRFETESYLVSIPYDAPPGRSVIQVSASDPDLANNGDVTYWIKNTHGMFEIDAKTGLVRLAARLPGDRQNSTFEMEVFAQDHGVTPNIGKAMLIVRASNTQNHPPKFERFSYLVAVDENVSGIPLLKVTAVDPDPGKAGKVHYRIVKSTKPDIFRIDRNSGRVLLEKPLDYEETKYLEIMVEAKDEAREPQFTTAVIQVVVNDVNDNPPQILSMPRILRVPQSTSPNNEVIYTVRSIDADSERNGNNLVTYDISPPSAFFAINPTTGQIFATQQLLPITEVLKIVATDRAATGPMSTSRELRIDVYRDSIEEPNPVFTSVQYFVQSDTVLEAGASVLTPRATIPNGSPIWYNITSQDSGKFKRFAIDHDTGRITTTAKIDPSEPNLKQSVYHFIVTAHNRKEPLHYSEAGVVIKLSDANFRCPKFPFTQYYASISENSQVDTTVLPDLLVEDVEKMSGSRLDYQITEDDSNDNFYVDVHHGGVGASANVSLRVKKPLDRDSMPKFLQGIYTLTVTAANHRCSSSTRIKIMVEDVNDNNPVFTSPDYVVELKENTPIGHVVTTVSATDKDEIDRNKLRYHIVEGNEDEAFDMEEETGVITVKIVPDRERIPSYVLRMVAVDDSNNTGWANVHVTILDENDWTPTFLNETFLMNVTEGPTSIGTRLRLPVVDYDDGINREMEVYIVDGNADGEFRLDVDEGGPLLTIISELDREKYKVEGSALHLVSIAAKDRGNPPRIGTTRVAVVIQDINDTPPKFEKDSYFEVASENIPVGSVIATLKATDPDSSTNTALVYSFAKSTGKVPFEIDPLTGVVNVSRPLDISENVQYSITTEVFDGLWKGMTNLKIYVREAEERDPRFDQIHYRFAVPENMAGIMVGRVELKPRKLRINALMKYTIVNTEMRSLFNITSEGEIFTKRGLDREKKAKYVFTVMLEEKRPTTKITVSEVMVDVLDVNDEIPTFSQTYKGTIKENSPPGTQVIIGPPTIQAVDHDSGNNSIVHYSLAGEGQELFTILDSGSVLFTPKEVNQILDRESKAKYELKVTAMDNGNLSSTTQLTIEIEDENDNPPIFQHGPLFVLLPEIAKPGSKVVQVKATDADEKGPNSRIQYYITAGGKGDIRIDRLTGEIFVVGTLKSDSVYYLNVSAVDGAGLASKTNINVTVVDVNDHKPTFDQTFYQFEVLEGNYTKEKLRLGVFRARDEDTGRNGIVEYTMSNNVGIDFPFTIDIHTGELFANGKIDREQRETYNFAVTALDYGEPSHNSSVEVTIKVKDINDEKPRFFTDPYLAHVPENLDPGYKVTQIAAYDPDLGENGQVFYKLGDGHDNKFYIDGKDGTVWTLAKLDFEDKQFYNITVIAYDKGNPSLSSSAKLWVTVADTRDAVPDFPKAIYTLEVAENAKVGDTVFNLNAGEGPFKYSLLNGDVVDTFTVDTSTGRVKLAKPLDSVQRNHYSLMVKAEDDSDPPKFDTAEINILIGTGQGVRLFPKRLYKISVMENQRSPLNLIDLNSTDELAHRPVHYAIVGTDYDGLFDIESKTGQLRVTRPFDREARDLYNIKIKAENLGHHRVGKRAIPSSSSNPSSSSSKSSLNDPFNYHLAFDETLVQVTVDDENDNSPIFTNKGKPAVAAIPLEAAFGYQVIKLMATDADSGINSAIRYEILARGDDASSKFYIDPVTGLVRSMVSFALDGGKLFGFDVKATDREGSETGNSAVTNVFVYVLPETRMVLFVADSEPITVERRTGEVLGFLSNVTGYNVKMAKLEPHMEGEVQEAHSTDLFLYAVNPETNDIVDTDTLLEAFRQKSHSIVDNLRSFKIRRIQGVTVQEKISHMGATEIAIIALSSVIFLGTILAIALLCSSCKERKLHKEHSAWEQQRLYSTIKNPLMTKCISNPYGTRELPNGHSTSTYSTGDGIGGPGYSRASGRSVRSACTGTSWSSHKSQNSGSPATEL
ncbi:protocadherin Fat 4-like isoform X1 [Panonychus citri]|uniref:protocadherin Fat 4-like isoform X1 n=2 Tax=Panonychus citri TaxID=50023 RepID=UPI0023070623|nr:protocadherin Fat 4-like isoform X1 [Panonychus citri]